MLGKNIMHEDLLLVLTTCKKSEFSSNVTYMTRDNQSKITYFTFEFDLNIHKWLKLLPTCIFFQRFRLETDVDGVTYLHTHMQ